LNSNTGRSLLKSRKYRVKGVLRGKGYGIGVKGVLRGKGDGIGVKGVLRSKAKEIKHRRRGIG
jgi:hypothetical protein